MQRRDVGRPGRRVRDVLVVDDAAVLSGALGGRRRDAVPTPLNAERQHTLTDGHKRSEGCDAGRHAA